MAQKKKHIEILKLKYDFEKTVLFSVLAILLTSSFGIKGTSGLFAWVLGILILICIIVLVIFLIRLKKTINEIKEYYK